MHTFAPLADVFHKKKEEWKKDEKFYSSEGVP